LSMLDLRKQLAPSHSQSDGGDLTGRAHRSALWTVADREPIAPQSAIFRTILV
jgi:hypothetical protein